MTAREMGSPSLLGWLGVWFACTLGGCDRFVHESSPDAGNQVAQRCPEAGQAMTQEPAVTRAADVLPVSDIDDFAAIVRLLEERTAAATRDGEEPTDTVNRPMRWAILGSRAMRETGFTDLLTARLSALGGIELVEREALEAIAAEQVLAELGGTDAAGSRLRLGTLLRADRLLLVSHAAIADTADEAPDAVRLVIADCQTGARIGHEHWSGETGPEALIDGMIAAIDQTRRRFPGGVERIVGVSHFLSRNLGHHYDHRQAGYAYLLQRALALHPGTAVLEIEEARAIARELSLGTPGRVDGLRSRLVPVLVDGEFTISVDHAAGGQRVDLIVSIHRGSSVEEIRKTAVPPAEVVALLTRELPRQILALDDESARFSPAEQLAWLVARAEEFGRVGDWQHSLGLREAALLIDPDNVRVRLDVIIEYSLLISRPLPLPLRPEQVPAEEELREAYRAKVEAYLARMAHVEYLIRNRQVRADDLLGFSNYGPPRVPEPLRPGSFQWLSPAGLNRCIPLKVVFEVYAPNEARQADAFYRRIAREEFAVAEQSKTTFMETVYPLIPSLKKRHIYDFTAITEWVAYLLAYHKPKHGAPALSADELDRIYRWILDAFEAHSGPGRATQTRWAKYLLENCEHQAGYGVPSAETFDELFRVITEVLPVNSDLGGSVLEQLARFAQRDVRQQLEPASQGQGDGGGASRERPLVDFLSRLADHDQPVVQVYGRYGLLYRRALLWEQRWQSLRNGRESDEASELQAELSSLGEESRELWAFCESIGFGHRVALPGSVYRQLASLRPADPASAPPARVSRSWTHYTPGEEDRLPRLEHAGRIPLVVTTLSGESRRVDDEQWKRLRDRWGSAYRWSINTNWYPIVGWRKCTETLDVLWNEWAVLVMREKGAAQEILSETEPRFLDVKWDGRHLWVVTRHDGLRAVSPTGQVIRRIGSAEGLPPYDRGVVLHPIQPGVVFLAGSFGEQRRGWCAAVDLRSDPAVRVIHRATAVRSHVANWRETDPADWPFTPSYVHEHADGTGARRLLLVGRDGPDGGHRGPLYVDLESLEVVGAEPQDYPRRSSTLDADFLFYSGSGRLLRTTVWHHGPGVVELSGGSLLERQSLSERSLCESGAVSDYLLPLGEWVYLPEGRGYWYRIHRRTFEEQPVLSSAARLEISSSTIFRISAHYGIVWTSCSDGLHYWPYQHLLIHEPP